MTQAQAGYISQILEEVSMDPMTLSEGEYIFMNGKLYRVIEKLSPPKEENKQYVSTATLDCHDEYVPKSKCDPELTCLTLKNQFGDMVKVNMDRH